MGKARLPINYLESVRPGPSTSAPSLIFWTQSTTDAWFFPSEAEPEPPLAPPPLALLPT